MRKEFEIFNHEKNVARFKKYFPKKQILILDFKDFVKDTRGTYKKILKFMGVRDDGKIDFPNYKQGYEIRSQAFNNFILKYFHGKNKLKSFAKIIMSNEFAQKIADLNKKKKSNKKRSYFGVRGFQTNTKK